MTSLLAFLLALAVFIIAIVSLVATKLDVFDGGLILILSVAVILLTYPSVLNRSP